VSEPKLEVEEFIEEGELHEPCSYDDMMQQAGRLLDKSCSHEICGTVLFKATDGKYYAGTVEFVVSEANPDYVKDALAEQKAYAEERLEMFELNAKEEDEDA